MKKTLILVCFSLFVLAGITQERFFNLYPGWNVNVAYENDMGYLLMGLDSIFLGYESTPIFLTTDINGNLVETYRYVSDTIVGFSMYSAASYSMHEDYILVSGVYKEYLKTYVVNPILMYFNTTNYYLDSIIEFKQYINIDDCSAQFKFHSLYENTIQVFGTVQYSTDWNAGTFFGIYDTLTQLFMFKDYERPDHCKMTPYQAHPTNDGGYLLSTEQDMTYTYLEKVYACILKVDSVGNEKWRYIIRGQTIHDVWEDYEAATYRPRVFDAPDGNYWLVWTDPNCITEAALQSNPERTIRIAKLVDNGTSCEFSNEVDFYTQLDEFQRFWYIIQDSYQDENGDMFILLQNYGGYISALIKIHANGVGAWLRTYRCYPDDDGQSYTKLRGLIKTSDGGFMLTGEYLNSGGTMFPDGIQSSVVFKVDSCGCFDAEGCNAHCNDSYSEQFVYMQAANIFPNPASEQITVSFDYSGAKTEFVYKIYSVNGQLLQEGASSASAALQDDINSNFIVDILDLPSGYYMLQTYGGGKIYSGKFVKE